MREHETREARMERLRQLIQGVHVAMLTTISENGSLHSRPLATQEMTPDGELWFFIGKSSHKVAELGHDNRVNVSYSEPSDNRYVSVSGRAELVEDRAKASDLWNPAYRMWFPKGLDDPDLVLLKVNVEHAEYWDLPSSKMVLLLNLAKNFLMGKTEESVKSVVFT